MDICNPHNLSTSSADETKSFGIRIRLASDDPFRNLVGADWEATHWYNKAHQRDAALIEMSSRHLYSRIGDDPRLIFETVDR